MKEEGSASLVLWFAMAMVVVPLKCFFGSSTYAYGLLSVTPARLRFMGLVVAARPGGSLIEEFRENSTLFGEGFINIAEWSGRLALSTTRCAIAGIMARNLELVSVGTFSKSLRIKWKATHIMIRATARAIIANGTYQYQYLLTCCFLRCHGVRGCSFSATSSW